MTDSMLYRGMSTSEVRWFVDDLLSRAAYHKGKIETTEGSQQMYHRDTLDAFLTVYQSLYSLLAQTGTGEK